MLGLRAGDFLEHFSWGNCFFCTYTRPPILVVDSDRDNIALMIEVLKFCGYWAIAATSSQSALQLVTETPPALVLLELMLPETDGIALTRHLRQQGSYPIIALTSLPRFLFQIDALSAGCNEYLEKPVDIDQLANMIKRYLNNSFFSPLE